jgi:hypothetical protein
MQKILIVLLSLLASEVLAQKNKKIFYDSVGALTTFEEHWAQVVTGKYKSVYNKSTNSKTLVKSTKAEFDTELRKTDKRIRKSYRVGTDFPDFDVYRWKKVQQTGINRKSNRFKFLVYRMQSMRNGKTFTE